MRTLAVLGAGLLSACGGTLGAADTDTDTDAASTGEVVTTGTPSSSNGDTTSATEPTVGDDGSTGQTTGPAPNEPPTAVLDATPRSGVAPWTATLDGSGSSDPDGEIVSWAWSWDGGSADGETVQVDFEAEGCTEVTLSVTDDDGATASETMVLSTVAAAPGEAAAASVGTAPLPSAVLPRDRDTNVGEALFAGTLETSGFAEVRANILAEGVVVDSVSEPICGAAPALFALAAPIPAELRAFDVQLVAAVGETEVPFAEVADLVAGDIYLVNGQSNAFAAMYNGDANVNQTPFLRSFGINSLDPTTTANTVTWFPAIGNGSGMAGGIGQWAIRMANVLSEAHQVPIAVVNGSLGGQPIGYFQRNDEEPADLLSNYGRLLHRMRAGGLDQHVRGILWYQGESDGVLTDAHVEGFDALLADWAEDYPNTERIYVTQLRAGCGGQTIGIQEYQRTLPDRMKQISVMSTTGLDGHDGCHYAYAEGYELLGDHYAALLGRDLYGEKPDYDVQPPNPMSASLENGGTEIVITLRNAEEPLVFAAGAEADFVVEGALVSVVSGTAEAGELRLTLSGDATGATGITYLGHALAGPWITSAQGLGLLTFQNLPL
ncbi:MAG: sialate O-acetylesterase [Nannocystaceae bacterium]|nr:PKD domain-containing protein [bacterium]